MWCTAHAITFRTRTKEHHTSADEGIHTLKWPAKCPNLNPIKNLWARVKIQIDVNVFDCTWCRGDEPPAPRPKERFTAKVMVWGIIAHGLKFLVLCSGGAINGEE